MSGDGKGTSGVLALWQDCAEGGESEFERWFQTEHLAERLAVAGFRRGRRYEAIEAAHGFTCYDVDTPEVLTSQAYFDRLENPTPLTRKVMSSIMRNVSRTICRVRRREGELRGAVALTVQLEGEDPAEVDRLIAELVSGPGVARAEHWIAAGESAVAPTVEERIRGGDDRIASCLLIETLRERGAREAEKLAEARLRGAVRDVGVYGFLCALETTERSRG